MFAPSVDAAVDVVQFAALQWYVSEADGDAVIHVMRLGTCRGKCSVKYYTVDASAVAGGKYVATNGCLEFKDGEALKSFSVPVIASDSFDTTLSFMVSLESPDNCKIEPRLQTTPVYIIDDNTFPTDKY